MKIITASLPLNLYTSWVEVVESAIKEIMQHELCLPTQIQMYKLPDGCDLVAPSGKGYKVRKHDKEGYMWFDGMPHTFYENKQPQQDSDKEE